MKRSSLLFVRPRQVEVVEEETGSPAPGEVMVKVLVTAISPGTEMLVYRGQFPPEVSVDATIESLVGEFAYPLKYGYSAVGQVTLLGEGIDPAWQGRLMFAFHPHESHFLARLENLIPVPPDALPERAALLPSAETAVNFLLDGQPLIGEQVAVFGQGIVGLLTTALLARLPVASLVTVDRFPLRREASLSLGAHASVDAVTPELIQQVRSLLKGDRDYEGADLAYELSGSPSALDQAIAVTGFHGRIVIGSWYGQKRADLNLGGAFHRSRIRVISSQVSTLTPELSGRWTKTRRLAAAWDALRQIDTSQLITHRLPLADAAQAYQMIDEAPEQTIQVLLMYPD
jgi:2-desacetyl-2-hydroxyethyl bacteriochlorophyllide A dehydrogenase